MYESSLHAQLEQGFRGLTRDVVGELLRPRLLTLQPRTITPKTLSPKP